MGCEKSKAYQSLTSKGNNTNSKKNSLLNLPKGKAFILKRINQTNNKQDCLKNKVEMFIKVSGNIQNLQFKLQMKSYGISTDLGLTEYSNNSYGEYFYHTTFLVDYYFEIEQFISITVSRNSTRIDTREVTLGKIMGSKGNSFCFKVQDFDVEIQGKKILNEKLNIQFKLSNNGFNCDTTYFILSNKNDGINWRRVYKSEERVMNNYFDPVEIDSSALCLGDFSKRILVQMINARTGDILDSADFSVNEYIDNNRLIFSTGISCPVSVFTTKSMDFLDYIQAGMQINMVVGIDFTASNGEPTKPQSLHYISDKPNEYEQSMEKCGSIICYYDHDQKFPLLGFGAIPKGMNQVEHVFPLNFNFYGSPEVSSIKEMISVYRNAIRNVQLYGPTNFAPLIRNTIKLSLESGSKNYIILMIVTDGCITDQDDTITEIIKASRLPISIIIIGVGSADFSNMDELDGDDFPLSNSTGVVERDIVQFVEFRKFQHNSDKLAEEVLKEVPRQVEDYYRGKNIYSSY